MMIPYQHQLEISNEALAVIKEHGFVYLAMEERTGKTLTSILVAEYSNISKVLVITKKAAITGWEETLSSFPHKKHYTVINYHQVKKIEGTYDLVILDESHNYISGSPKPSSMFKQVHKIIYGLPIIFMSATPHAQGYHMLYHQLAMSAWSPWDSYKNFYFWFEDYGRPKQKWIGGRLVNDYTNTNRAKVVRDVEPMFITRTRKELKFKVEPKDIIHYIELNNEVKEAYNYILENKIYNVNDIDILCDTSMKLRTSLHMLEGGVAKTGIEEGSKSLILNNREKIDYILETWGDTDNLVIMYNYIGEGLKLNQFFKKARILQATSFAEGIDLHKYRHLVIYSQDFSTARHSQRRARQANKSREHAILVHFLLVRKAISDQVYTTVSINKHNFIDSTFKKDTL